MTRNGIFFSLASWFPFLPRKKYMAAGLIIISTTSSCATTMIQNFKSIDCSIKNHNIDWKIKPSCWWFLGSDLNEISLWSMEFQCQVKRTYEIQQWCSRLVLKSISILPIGDLRDLLLLSLYRWCSINRE